MTSKLSGEQLSELSINDYQMLTIVTKDLDVTKMVLNYKTFVIS